MDRAGQYRWTLHAGNGEPVATSEGYATYYGVIASISVIRRIVPVAVVR